MQLNMVNELKKPKKVLTYTADPNVTIGDLLRLLDQDGLISLGNQKNAQILLNSEKVLLNNKTLASYNISSQDTLFIIPHQDVVYEEGDANVQKMIKLGFSKEQILAALLANNSDSEKALRSLFEELKQKEDEEGDGEEDEAEEVEERYKDIQPYITKALDTISDTNQRLYAVLGENDDKLREFCDSFKNEYTAYFEGQQKITEEDIDVFIGLFIGAVSNDPTYA